MVYARRIELGFMDKRDSLGRLFHQRAKPYVKPAYVEATPAARQFIIKTYAAALRG